MAKDRANRRQLWEGIITGLKQEAINKRIWKHLDLTYKLSL
jgi:hypothetical protein